MTDFSGGLPCITAGWGIWKVNVGPDGKYIFLQPDTLQILTNKIMDKAQCKKNVVPSKKRLPDSVICTEPSEFRGICKVIQIKLYYFCS